MPTYQYRCKECDHDFEVVQSFTDDPLEDCPACGGRLKKVYGNVGISFKGSGFYKTDSRGGKKATTAASSSTDSSTSSSDSTKSSEPASGDKKPSTSAASTGTSTSKD